MSSHHQLRFGACLGASALLFTAQAGAQVSHYGTACASTSGVTPTLDVETPAYAGAPYALKLTGPANATTFLAIGTRATSADLAFLGFPAGCKLLVNPIGVALVGLDSGGQAEIVTTAGAAGLSAVAQHVAADFGSGVLAVSDGLSLAVQPSPTIDSFGPTGGGSGTILDLSGSNLPPNPEKNVCFGMSNGGLLTPEPGGKGFVLLQVQPYGTDVQAGPISLMVGAGEYQLESELPPPPPGLVPYPDLRILQGIADPASSASSSASFNPAPPTPGFTAFAQDPGEASSYSLTFAGKCEVGDCLKVWMRIWQANGKFTDVFFVDPTNNWASKTLPICTPMDENECALWACGWTKASLKNKIPGFLCKVVGANGDTVQISVDTAVGSAITKLEGGYWVQKGGCNCDTLGGPKAPTTM